MDYEQLQHAMEAAITRALHGERKRRERVVFKWLLSSAAFGIITLYGSTNPWAGGNALALGVIGLSVTQLALLSWLLTRYI